MAGRRPAGRARGRGLTVPPPRPGAPAGGALLCLLSAVGFGSMAIFGKLAYEEGVSTATLLLVRFGLAGAAFAAVVAARADLREAPVTRRVLLTGLALGAVGYATQAGLYFAALRRMDASLLALVLYTYPAWVVLAAFALGRESPTRRGLTALALSALGLVIVLAGASSGSLDAAGVAMGLGASFAYTVYILVSDRTVGALPALALSALVCLGAAITFTLFGAATGTVDFGFGAAGWLWLGLLAAVATVLAIAAFFAGLARVGPGAASILSTFEPVVTVVLAWLAFSERLTLVQLAGAALVLAAAVLLAMPRRA